MQINQDVIAIYSRKSRFTGKGESISNQVDLCRSYIRTTFGAPYADSAMVFEDEGFSGGNLHRPDFKRMLTAAKAHQFKAVVVYRLDRISRNIGDFSHLIETLGYLNIDFISIREQFDTSSPMGRAMMYIASVFSQLERETIAERIRDNMHELAKTGRWLGGVTPTGYTSEQSESIAVDGKRKKSCHLKLIPAQAETVRKIFDFYTETDSLTKTEAELLRQQVKTKTGHNFTRFSIKSILQNPVYLIADADAYTYFQGEKAEVFSSIDAFDGLHGILAYNRTDQEKGRATINLPPSEWIISVGQHPGIIPSKQWIRVQHSLARNQSKSYRKPRTNTALLTGLLWCSCGSRMYPKLSQRTAPDGTPIYSYVCQCKAHSKRSLCNAPNINGNLLDTLVLEQLQSLTFNPKTFCTQLTQIKHLYQKQRDPSSITLAALQQQQAEIQHKINCLIDSLTNFSDSTAALHIQNRIEALHNDALALNAQIAELAAHCQSTKLSPADFEKMFQHLIQFDLHGLSVEQKRNALRLLVSQVVWDGRSATVTLSSTEDMDVPDCTTQTPWCAHSK